MNDNGYRGLGSRARLLEWPGATWGLNKDMNEILQDYLADGVNFCAYVPGVGGSSDRAKNDIQLLKFPSFASCDGMVSPVDVVIRNVLFISSLRKPLLAP
jgi:hypothetical protein